MTKLILDLMGQVSRVYFDCLSSDKDVLDEYTVSASVCKIFVQLGAALLPLDHFDGMKREFFVEEHTSLHSRSLQSGFLWLKNYSAVFT